MEKRRKERKGTKTVIWRHRKHMQTQRAHADIDMETEHMETQRAHADTESTCLPSLHLNLSNPKPQHTRR